MANPGLTKTYDALSVPTPVQSALATATTGGTLAAGTYYYVVTALIGSGETVASNEQSIVTTGSTSENTVNYALPSGATGGKVYRGTTAGGEGVYFSVAAGSTSFVDTGAAGTAGTPPAVSSAVYSFPAYSIVKFTSTDFNVAPASSHTDPIAGVLTEVSASSGERVDVIHGGIAYVLSGGTINAGDALTTNGSGQAITTTTANDSIIGFARQSAVAGDVFEALIVISKY